MTGASLGNDTDKILVEANAIARRLPFQVDATLKKINKGDVMFLDQHLSETVEQLRSGQLAPVDIAVIGPPPSPKPAPSCPRPRWAIRPVSRSWLSR